MNKKKKSKIILGLLVAVVALGVGYAAITGVNLLINGTSSVKSSDANFVVRFVKNIAEEQAMENPVENAITISGKQADGTSLDVSGMTASVTDDTHATFAVGDMTEVGSYAEFTYNIVNESDGVDAMLSLEVADENDAEDYFEVTKSLDKSVISTTELAKAKVKVKLVKRPVVSDVTGTFKVTLTANPVEEEDNSGSISGSTQEVQSASSLAKALQNDNIDTIELTDDITINKQTSLVVNDDTDIDFNGNTLTVEPGSIKVENGAELTLEDSTNTGGISASNNAVTVESGNVIVESGTYNTTEYLGRGSVITIPKDADNAKITINGGTINGDYFAISSFGDGEVEINGGEINSTATVKNTDESGKTYHAYAVRLSDGHITINDGAINGIHGGLGIINSATATVNGGTITLNNSYAGAKDSYYCLYVEGNASAEVNDGTFVNNGTNPLVYSSSTGLVNLRGGNWTAKSTKAFNGSPNAGKDSIKVYGGTYKKNTNDTLTDYNIADYMAN